MILLKKFRQIATNNVICLRPIVLTSSHTKYTQSKTVKSTEENLIANIRDKLCCTEDLAQYIFNKCPSLQTVGAIKNDTLNFLRGKLTEESITENPELITMDMKSLERKIDLLIELEPKSLDDFAPLLILSDKELKSLVKKLSKESHEIEQKNRIYYLSEKLKVEPKVISRYCSNYKQKIFSSSFQSFRKKLNIVLDYGVSRMDVLSGLYALRCSDGLFVRRSEQMLSVGLPIKMWYYQLSEKDFNEKIRNYRVNDDEQNKFIAAKMAKKLKKRNLEKATIVETLKSLLECDDIESTEIYYNHVNEISELTPAKENINYLLSIGIDLEMIRKNGFLLTMPLKNIQEKLEIIKQMAPEKIEHFVPLMSADTLELDKYKCSIIKCNAIGREHPIYYFSKKLNISPDEVATYFAKHRRTYFECSSIRLKSKLDLLLELDVEPSSILNCPLTFRYGDTLIKLRISTLKSSGIDKIDSWMVIEMNPPKHERLVFEHMVQKQSLEGFENNMAYLAHRLGWSEADLLHAMEKYPRLSKCSAKKIKEHLDYFLNETNFTPQDIASFPYILGKNLDSIKARIKQMTDIGALVTLPVLYQGKTKYTKLIQKYSSKSAGEIEKSREKH